MNKRDKFQIIKHGLAMLWFWKRLNDEAEEVAKSPDWRPGRCSSWHKHGERQAYHDALLSLKNLQLIESYDVTDVKIQMDGKWYGHADIPQRHRLRFVRSRLAK